MADDNKKTAAARGKQFVSCAGKSASLNASSQVVGQRARRFGACASAPRTRAQAKRIAAGLSVGAHRVKKASREGLWYVSVARDNRSLTRESCREARCVLAALPEKRPYVSAATHASMQGNKSKDTKPELLVRERLREAGLGGYRLQWKAPVAPMWRGQAEGVPAHQWLLLGTGAQSATLLRRKRISNTGCQNSNATWSATSETSLCCKNRGGACT